MFLLEHLTTNELHYLKAKALTEAGDLEQKLKKNQRQLSRSLDNKANLRAEYEAIHEQRLQLDSLLAHAKKEAPSNFPLHSIAELEAQLQELKDREDAITLNRNWLPDHELWWRHFALEELEQRIACRKKWVEELDAQLGT